MQIRFRLTALLVLALPVEVALAGGPLWQGNSLSLLYGQGYKVTYSDGAIATFEHASKWNWGDLFLFVDLIEYDNDDSAVYGELKPRLSLGKLFDRDFSAGPVKDMFLAAELNQGDGGVESHNAGIGFSLDVPGARFFNLNVYHRNDRNLDGQGMQVVTAWAFPFELGAARLLVNGFADWTDNEGARHSNFMFVPQVMLDVGAFIGQPGRLFAGIEYQHWDNKFGLAGVPGLDTDERVVQALAKFHF